MLDSVKKAANWWTQQVTGTAKFDAGSEPGNFGLDMASMLASILSSESKKHQSSDAPENFSKYLEEKLTEELQKNPERTIYLRVDYHPEGILSDACTYSGVSGSTLPWKTTMWVTKDSCKVSNGYQAPVVKL